MKRATLMKIASFAIIGVCSSLATSSILAQIKKPRASGKAANTGKIVESFTKVKVDPLQVKKAVPANRSFADPSLIASTHLDRVDVDNKNGGIAVSAQATLMDKRPKYFYVWTISVRDATGNEVSGRNYDEQRFALPSGPVTFNEVIPAKPGRYSVELKLWHARPNLDLTSLRAQREPHPDLELSRAKSIEVGD